MSASSQRQQSQRSREDPWARKSNADLFARGLTDSTQTYYQLLGVAEDASLADITRAYRQAMKALHPDRQTTDAARQAAHGDAQQLNLAFATLRNPEKRRGYDQSILAQTVQDELLGRYFGGFMPGEFAAADPLASRPPSARQRQERSRADREAIVSLGLVFGGVTVILILAIVLWAVLGEAVSVFG